MTFYGNPNVPIASIDTSGGIAVSFSSRQLPAFVQVSAKNITAVGTSYPQRDLEFSWDFGDASGTETATRPLNEACTKYEPNTVNLNNKQTGPRAAYVYRTAGSKIITLTVRGKDSGGSYVTAQKTFTFTASAFSASGGEWWFDSAAAAGGDGSIGAPFNDVATLNTKIASNTAIHVKKGSVFSGSVAIALDGNTAVSGLRIDTYGTGAKPSFRITSGTEPAIAINNGGATPHNREDIVISGIDFRNGGSFTGTEIHNGVANDNGGGKVEGYYCDNCDFVNTLTAPTLNVFRLFAGEDTTGIMARCGLWNCNISGPEVSGSGKNGYFGGANDWNFIVGGTISGGGTDPIKDHHIYEETQTEGLYSCITFGNGPDRSYCINGNYDNSTDPSFVDGLTFTDLDFTGVQRALDLGNRNNNNPSLGPLTWFRNVVTQRCALHGLSDSGLLTAACGESITYRDLLVWDCDEGRFWDGWDFSATHVRAEFYRIRGYRVPGAGPSASDPTFTWLDTTYTQPQTITDILWHDTRTTAKSVDFVFADQVSAGSLINRNQWYAPNDSNGSTFYDNGVEKSFVQWQTSGFDPSGSTSNPGFANPSIGDFTIASDLVTTTTTTTVKISGNHNKMVIPRGRR